MVRFHIQPSLIAAAVLLAGCEEGTTLSAPTCELEVRLDDGTVSRIAEGGRAPAVFGSQGALMIILGVHGIPAEDHEAIVVTAEFESNRQTRRGFTSRRRATVGPDGAPHVDHIVFVVEQVGAHFDAEIPRTVEVSIDVESESGVCSATRRFDIDIVGQPFRPAASPVDEPSP